MDEETKGTEEGTEETEAVEEAPESPSEPLSEGIQKAIREAATEAIEDALKAYGDEMNDAIEEALDALRTEARAAVKKAISDEVRSLQTTAVNARKQAKSAVGTAVDEAKKAKERLDKIAEKYERHISLAGDKLAEYTSNVTQWRYETAAARSFVAALEYKGWNGSTLLANLRGIEIELSDLKSRLIALSKEPAPKVEKPAPKVEKSENDKPKRR